MLPKNKCLVCLLFLCNTVFCQTNISGVINDYIPVISIVTCNSITVQNAATFSVGDRALIIQMQGAVIDSISNNSSFGHITNYASAGNYEFNTIAQINGSTITFQTALVRSYSVNGRVQLVRVPQYSSVNVNGTLTCQAWNGSTGGVLVFEATDTVSLNASVDVSGKGFRGGLTLQNIVCPGCANVPNYFYTLAADITGEKGEGIFLNVNPNFSGGKGAIANGGGSGSCKNGGGGGGSNIGHGGIGGLSFNVCSGSSSVASGIGGYTLDSVSTLNKVFLGGGGGGGDSDDPVPLGTNGTSGGGIVIINTSTLLGNGQTINGSGLNQTLVAGNDGAGGGGGGGSVLLDVNNYSGTASIIVKGGNGGNNSSTFGGYCHAPGGGGGGGLVWFSQSSVPAGVAVNIGAGSPGNILNSGASCTGTTYGAGSGTSGSNFFNLQFPTLPTIVTVLNSNAPICLNDTLKLFVNTIAGATYSWTGPNGFNSVVQNPFVLNFVVNDTGYYFVDILINNCPYATDSILVNSFSNATSPSVNSNSPVCEGDTLHFNASFINGATYLWTGPGGFQSNLQNPVINNVQPADSGNYFLTIQLSGCNSLPDTLGIIVVQKPATPVINSSSPVCVGDTLSLSGNSGAANYFWTGPNGFQSSQSNPVILNAVLSDSGIYNLYVNVNGCVSDTSLVYVIINPIPNTPNVNSSSPVCEGDTLQLQTSIQSNTIYSWNGPNGFQSNLSNPLLNNVALTASGNYSLSISQSGCTSLSANLSVQVDTLPVGVINSNSPLCVGDTLQLSANSVTNGIYSWNGPNGFQSSAISFNINNIGFSDSGYYYLTIQQNNCRSLPDSLNIIINPIPATPSITTNAPICEGDTLHLSSNVSGNVSYQWFGENSFQSTLANPSITNILLADSGNYFLIAQVIGCLSDTATTFVSIISRPQTPVISSNSPLCSGDTLYLSTATQISINYSWTGPNGFLSSITNPFLANTAPSNAGNYFLTIEAGSCKSLPASTNVIILDAPVINLSDRILCQGDQFSIDLTTNSGTTFNWSGPNGFTSTGAVITINNIDVTSQGIYIVTATNACGTTTDSMMLIVNASIESAFVPNCFTPNSDGRNDVYAIDSIQKFNMLIYNRWGQLLADLNENKNKWDGTYGGKNCTEGVYFYIMEGADCKGSYVKRTGHITIMK